MFNLWTCKRKDSFDPRGTVENEAGSVTNNFSNDPNFSWEQAKIHVGCAHVVPTRDTWQSCLEQEEWTCAQALRSSFSPVSHPNLAHVIINRLITVDKNNRKDTVLSRRSERGCFMRNLLVKQFLRGKGREKPRQLETSDIVNYFTNASCN